MAPIKYEEQMKDKLEKRSLQPSADSWATLANRLEEQDKKKKTSLFRWFGVAASIVGILFITVMYFNNKSFENSTTIIVDTKENVIQENETKIDNQVIDTNTHSDKKVAEELKSVKNSSDESITKSNVKVDKHETLTIQKTLPEQEAIVQVEKDMSQESIEKVSEIKEANFTFEEQKIQDVVAQINNLKAEGNSVTDTEIDSLLKKAQKEILSNRLYNENTRTVDANVLLQDVEADLQQSFRSKVFEALQSGYESVKTAVAERNN
jgi:ABC-type Na+ efflux pump permease subunit